MQSGPISRELHVHPPLEWEVSRVVVFKLLKLPYGVSEKGRQWVKTIENWMLLEAKLKRVNGMSQL